MGTCRQLSLVSYPDPGFHSSGWLLRKPGSGYETWLSSLALMNTHYAHAVNYNTAVEIFFKMHPRRIELNLLME